MSLGWVQSAVRVSWPHRDTVDAFIYAMGALCRVARAFIWWRHRWGRAVTNCVEKLSVSVTVV